MMNEGDDVLQHINKIKTLAEQLDAMGAPVSEDDLMITLLASLSELYAFLIMALESRCDSLSWKFVTSRLMHVDMKRKEQGDSVDGAAHGQGQAFMTTDNGRRKERQAPSKPAVHAIIVENKDIGSTSAQRVFVRARIGNGRLRVQTSRRVKTTLVIFSSRL